MRGKVIGRCIYCRSDENLTREHVIPVGLNGEFVLGKATCENCRKKTEDIERRVLRTSMRGMRIAAGMRTRHRQELPATLPAQVRRGRVWHDVDLPINQYTGGAILPLFGPPTETVGGPDPGGLVAKGSFVLTATPSGADTSLSVATRAGGEAYRVLTAVDLTAFARLIAKIAHGYAVDFFGLDGFEPNLPPAILGDAGDIHRWVGSPASSMFDAPAERGHRVRVGVDRRGTTVIAAVQLFADAGAPEYFVVVGRPSKPEG